MAALANNRGLKCNPSRRSPEAYWPPLNWGYVEQRTDQHLEDTGHTGESPRQEILLENGGSVSVCPGTLHSTLGLGLGLVMFDGLSRLGSVDCHYSASFDNRPARLFTFSFLFLKSR